MVHKIIIIKIVAEEIVIKNRQIFRTISIHTVGSLLSLSQNARFVCCVTLQTCVYSVMHNNNYALY